MRRLLIVFPLLFVTPLGAQNATRQAGVDGAQYVPPLAALLSPRGTESELRDIVNRFNADESALGRRWTVDYAPMRRARFREFYHGWQSRLRELDFDKLSQQGRIDYVLMNHSLRTAVIDRTGTLVASIEGNTYSPEQLGDLVLTQLN